MGSWKDATTFACGIATGAVVAALVMRSSKRSPTKRPRILVMNGKGLDTRGQTEESRQQFQSTAQYPDYVEYLERCFKDLGVDGELFQCNNLDVFVAKVMVWDGDAIVMNPAFFSYEARVAEAVTASQAKGVPVIEVHYSNYLRKKECSVVSKVAQGVVVGGKLEGYRKAIEIAKATQGPEWTRFDIPPASATGPTVEDLRREVASADVVFFDSESCPFCREAEGALRAKGIEFKIIPIDSYKSALREAVKKASAPSVWIKGTYVGGCNDGTESWHGVMPMLKNGKFEEMLRS